MIGEPDEVRVVALAKEIAGLGGRSKAGAYDMSLATRVMMRFAMRLPQFQTQLFRFVDVFPAIGTRTTRPAISGSTSTSLPRPTSWRRR